MDVLALDIIKKNLNSLIDDYEEGIEDCFMRGFVQGSIETYGELISYDRDKTDEPFHDYCMRLKEHLATQLEDKHAASGGCLFHNFKTSQYKEIRNISSVAQVVYSKKIEK